jgi:hypothetical protein
LFNLRTDVTEGMLAFIRDHQPRAIARTRAYDLEAEFEAAQA